MRRMQIQAKGIVQGVGFRPFIYSIANRFNLSGYVFNDTGGVIVEVEGDDKVLDEFFRVIREDSPPLAQIESIERSFLPLMGYREFTIRDSKSLQDKSALIPPDISICKDCLKEMLNPIDRRFLYPFINCTNCGPRYTLIKDIPYDRRNTTMKAFEMCPECKSEYEDPLNRRFHAQPNACPVCGPQVSLLAIKRSGTRVLAKGAESIKRCRELLKRGMVVAVKGLGGFHLACNALDKEAVRRLRSRKYREDKPFAMMAPSLEVIKRYCYVDREAERCLVSPGRPIVLLKKGEGCEIPEEVAPKQRYLGFMLPYSPLHNLLFTEGGESSNLGISLEETPLVMTSGNISDEPISYINDEVLERLKDIADYFLMHNRDIYIRCDDSVTRMFNGREMIARRSRGYVPTPLEVIFPFNSQVLACGAELKNTFCFGKGNYAFISHHIGDLRNMETLNSFEEGVEHFQKVFNLNPEIVAHDLHPDYLSTRFAKEVLIKKRGRRLTGVQHHHAHIASCMADNNINEKVIGVALDGTGYGDDGRIWGGEFLVCDFMKYERRGYLEYFPLPGGDMAIRQPWRMGAVYLYSSFGDEFLDLDIEFAKRLDRDKWHIIRKMIERGVNIPYTSSMGRLFAGVSSILGIRDEINYEGQAAIELEMYAHHIKYRADYAYPFDIRKSGEKYVIDPRRIIKGIVKDLKEGIGIDKISAKFHYTIARMILRVCDLLRKSCGIESVVLSGGVFQNMLLLEMAKFFLDANGFNTYIHSRVPANDGGISLGQAVIASARG